MLCSPANSTAGLRFGGTSESKKNPKSCQNIAGQDLERLVEQVFGTIDFSKGFYLRDILVFSSGETTS